MEYKAGESIEALQKSIKEKSKVLRNKTIRTILTEDIVIGDIVYLVEGDKVPADGRIVEVNELSVDESMLTGESKAVNKTDQVIKNKDKLTDQLNMVFMGTSILKGSATMLVTATADDTEMGNISSLLQQAKPKRTPLEKRLEQTGRFLILLTLVISFIVLLMGIISGNEVETMIKTTVALAIAAVPEGLPAAATITLAIGMKRMAKKDALLRNLPAVETLGSTTVLCTDKTGTLTENKMTLKKIVTFDKTFYIKGSGYDDKGSFLVKDKAINPLSNQLLSKVFKVFYFCNESKLQPDGDDYSVVGDPTEGALLIALKKANVDEEKINSDYKQKELLPFDPEKKYMAAHYASNDKKHFIALKGAPHVILSMCDYYMDKSVKKLTKKAKAKIMKQNDALSDDSYRVLALAYKEMDEHKSDSLNDFIDNDLIYLGLTALQDPARSGIKESIQQTKGAGIKTVMLTGDQQNTAIGIAKDLGIEVNQDNLPKDKAIKDYSKKELLSYLKDNHIFSRVTPEDKLLIIEALQENNEIVAMTGDGVNDAPALKKADIGIAMGKRGSSVAKEAADMILVDDRYQTIIEAIKQGRVIFDNIQKFIHYLLSCNLSEILLIFFALLIGLPIPLIALQILWLNVVTGVFPALSMAWELPEKNVMANPPIDPKSKIITPSYQKRIGFHGFIIALGPLVVYYSLIQQNLDIELARTSAFMTLALVHLLQVFNVRSKNGFGFNKSFFKNKFLMGSLLITFLMQLFAIYFKPLQTILRTRSIALNLWVYIIIGAVIPILAIQLATKLTIGRRN